MAVYQPLTDYCSGLTALTVRGHDLKREVLQRPSGDGGVACSLSSPRKKGRQEWPVISVSLHLKCRIGFWFCTKIERGYGLAESCPLKKDRRPRSRAGRRPSGAFRAGSTCRPEW